MGRHRTLILFVVAWVSALLLSLWVWRRSVAPQSPRDLIQVVAAARDLPIGNLVRADDLKMVALERKDLPREALLKTADAVGRAVAVPIAASEPILARKLAAKGSGEGLTALIEPGMRALSVQVNEISGVAGFIQPGTRVDVLFTRVFSNGDAATTTILQNVRVIAYGRKLDAAAGALDTRDLSRPTAATLLVTQEQAEVLVLAQQRGRIQLALRNSLDEQVTEASEPVKSGDLGIEEPRKPVPVPPVAATPRVEAAAGKTGKAEKDPRVVVRVFRGEKVTEEKFP